MCVGGIDPWREGGLIQPGGGAVMQVSERVGGGLWMETMGGGGGVQRWSDVRRWLLSFLSQCESIDTVTDTHTHARACTHYHNAVAATPTGTMQPQYRGH